MNERLSQFPGPQAPGHIPVLLAVFAHPDDETFTAGGTLALHAEKGWRVKLVCVTHGESGSAGREGLDLASYKKRRTQELRQAAQLLGIDELILRDWGDGRVAQRPHEEAVAELVEVMRRTRPDVVITFGPDGISGHPDHVAISRLTTTAFNQYRASTVDQVGEPQLYYVVRSAAIPSCCLKRKKAADVLPVTTRINIRCSWPQKIAAMRAYQSQKHLIEALQKDLAAWNTREELFHQAF